MLREAYMLVALNLKRARDEQPITKTKDPSKFRIRDLVLLKNYMKQT